MSETNKAPGENGFVSLQPMWKVLFPWASAQPAEAEAESKGHPLEEQFTELRDTWQASVGRWTEFAQEAAQGEMPSPDKLREIFSPASWTGPGSGVLDAALQRVLEGPRYAVLWDLDRQLLALQKLTLERDKAVAVYQAVVQKAWGRAFERFSKGLAADPRAAGRRTWRNLVDQWLAVANDTLIEVHRSDEFVEAQRRMLRAASDRHLQERKIAEAWCEAAHVPTRTEVDELQRLVVELRREVRALRRVAPAVAEVTSAAPTRSTPARRPRAAAKRARA